MQPDNGSVQKRELFPIYLFIHLDRLQIEYVLSKKELFIVLGQLM